MRALVLILLAVAVTLLGTMAWNFVMPLFGLPVLTLWQFFALNFLIGVLSGQIKLQTKK